LAELTGQTFAGFEIVAKLGEGGMGAVYKARQPLLDRFVALKVMSPQLSGDPAYVARFIREAASAAKLTHPNMVQVHTAGEQEGIYYIVMEFVEGESLSHRLRRVGALDPVEAIAITLHVATALQCAWNEAKLIHRDIKPDNIFLSNKGDVKVGDLGLAKSVGGGATEMTQSGMMMGSPHYISPEQARASKETDFRADIYSLGCTLYQLLSGTTPYHADEALAVVLKHVTDPVPDVLEVMPQCPQALAALVRRMMAKAPDQRHASYEELIAELWRVSDLVQQQQSAPTAAFAPAATTATATLRPAVRQDSKSVIRDSRLVIGGIVAAATILVAGLFFWSPWSTTSSQNSNAPSLQHSNSLAASSAGILAPPETRVTVLTATPKVGEVYTLPLGSNVTVELMGIPPGEFMLGSTKTEQAWALANSRLKQADVENEGEAPRKATIKQGFWMGRTEVTVGQWKEFVAATGYVTDGEKKGESIVYQEPGKNALMKGKSWKDPNFGEPPKDNDAVCCISWNDAKAFCDWLTYRERELSRLPSGFVVRLPTEAEWEYACRGGMQTKFWWGESVQDAKDRLNCLGKGDGFEFVAPVDSFGLRGRNWFGLADMLGNVWEWCLDAYDTTRAHEDLWMVHPSVRVLRGSDFINGMPNCRCAVRHASNVSISHAGHGFRLCYGVDVSAGKTTTVSTSSAAAPKESGILAPPETSAAPR
jgi:serine/threonine protein kinase